MTCFHLKIYDPQNLRHILPRLFVLESKITVQNYCAHHESLAVHPEVYIHIFLNSAHLSHFQHKLLQVIKSLQRNDQNITENFLDKWPTTTWSLHFMFAWEFFAYHWSPNKLVFMKPLNRRI